MSYNYRAELNAPRRFREDDEISLISMQELAPTPIEDGDYIAYDFLSPPDRGKTGPQSSARTLPPPTSYTPPSRGLAIWLARTQKYSSYMFTSFLGIHAATAAVTPLFLGLEAGDSSILLARTYFYQAHPYVESLLIPGSLLVHIGSGLGLRAYRHYQQRQRYGGKPPEAVSQWRLRNFSGVSLAGWASIPFVAAHAGLTRGVPLWVDGDSSDIGLGFLSHGFWLGRWGKWVGTGFYTVMIGLVSYHVVFGWAKYLKVNSRNRRVTTTVAAAVAGTWLSGVFVVARSGPVRGYLGRHYDHLYSVFFLGA